MAFLPVYVNVERVGSVGQRAGRRTVSIHQIDAKPAKTCRIKRYDLPWDGRIFRADQRVIRSCSNRIVCLVNKNTGVFCKRVGNQVRYLLAEVEYLYLGRIGPGLRSVRHLKADLVLPVRIGNAEQRRRAAIYKNRDVAEHGRKRVSARKNHAVNAGQILPKNRR